MDQDTKPPSPEPPNDCSICLDPLAARARSVATLQCGHEFHLDCIGSAFNAKGAMECPYCRKVEKGQWLYADGRPSGPNPDEYYGFWIPSETIHLLEYPPYDRHIQLTLQDQEVLGSLGDIPSSAHLLPYLYPNGMEDPATADSSNVQGFDGSGPRSNEMFDQYLRTLRMLGTQSEPSSPLGTDVPRDDHGSHPPSSGPYAYPYHYTLLDRPALPTSGNSMVASIEPSPLVAQQVTDSIWGPIVWQTTVSSTPAGSTYPPVEATTFGPSTLPMTVSNIAVPPQAEAGQQPRDASLARALASTDGNSNLPNGGVPPLDQENFWRPETWGIPSAASFYTRPDTERPPSSAPSSGNGHQPPRGGGMPPSL